MTGTLMELSRYLWSVNDHSEWFALCPVTHLVRTVSPASICVSSSSSSIVIIVAVRRHLRSATSPTLLVPSSRRSTLGDRAFPVAASRARNSLPAAVRDTPSLLCFRRRLKTLLFQSSFHCLLSALYSHSVSVTDCV